ncbi:YkgJ family cysteine cluster protein [Candidatus Auribacterota bacterium]
MKTEIPTKEKNTWSAKLKRTFTAFLPVDPKRKGSCQQCTACCALPNKCPFLVPKNGKDVCTIYKYRPLNCRKYPRTTKEQICFPCGYFFGN